MPNQDSATKTVHIEINKTKLKQLGIVAGIVIVLFGLLFLFVFLSRSSVETGMVRRIQSILDENKLEYQITKMDELQSGAALNVLSYGLVDSEKKENKHAVVVRMNTLYGPFATLFIYNSDSNKASFIDVLDLNGFAKKTILSTLKDSQTSYWAGKIPSIMRTGANITSSKGESK